MFFDLGGESFSGSVLKILAHAQPSPQLHHAADVPRGEDPADVVEVADKDAAVGTAGQCQRRQQLVALSLAVTAGTRDTAAPAVSCRETHTHMRGCTMTSLCCVQPVALIHVTPFIGARSATKHTQKMSLCATK